MAAIYFEMSKQFALALSEIIESNGISASSLSVSEKEFRSHLSKLQKDNSFGVLMIVWSCSDFVSDQAFEAAGLQKSQRPKPPLTKFGLAKSLFSSTGSGSDDAFANARFIGCDKNIND